MALWKAGTAKSTAIGSEWMGSQETTGTEKPKGLLSQALGIAGCGMWAGAKYSLGIFLAVQALSMGVQVEREWASSGSIAKMQAEQRWMEGQGLAGERRIGVVSSGKWAHFTNDLGTGAFSGNQRALGGWDLVAPLSVIADIGALALGGKGVFDEPNAISAPRDKVASSTIDPDLKMTYRHEEAHARAHDKQLRAGVPAAWPKAVGKAISEGINAASGFPAPEGASPIAKHKPEADWRMVWMEETRSEAFADAFAVLTASRKGKGELARAAMETHAFRILGDAKGVVTSPLVAGATHSVEMASFIAGQLDEDKVAALSSNGMEELAGKIADDALAWAVARQAPLIGFFEPAGAAWWSRLAKDGGIGEAEAKALWSSWSTEAQSPYPKAAFGVFAYKVQGADFKVRGLDKGLAGSTTMLEILGEPAGDGKVELKERIKNKKTLTVSTNWRYDGHGGTVVDASAADPSLSERVGTVLVGKDGILGLDAKKAKTFVSEEVKARWEGANQGTVTQHLLLAQRLGLDMDKQAEWLDEKGAKDAFPGLAQFYADAFRQQKAIGRAVAADFDAKNPVSKPSGRHL